MKQSTTIIISILFFALFLAVNLVAAESALRKREKYECRKWQKWNEQYDGFYYVGWQESQCHRYNLLPENYEVIGEKEQIH